MVKKDKSNNKKEIIKLQCYVCSEYLNQKRKGDIDTDVCLDCRKQNIFISKTRAKKEYCLDDNDIDNLFNMEIHTHSHGKSQWITMFLIEEIKDKADEKYDDFEKYKKRKEEEKYKKNIESEKNKEIKKNKKTKEVLDIYRNNNLKVNLDENLEKYIDGKKSEIKKKNLVQYILNRDNLLTLRENRKNLLTDVLAKRGLQLRDDSTVCNAYIEGNLNQMDIFIKNDVDEIADLMEEMNFYFTKTNYKKISEILWKKNSDRNYYDRLDASDINRKAKKEALNQYIKLKNENIQLVPECMIAKYKL